MKFVPLVNPYRTWILIKPINTLKIKNPEPVIPVRGNKIINDYRLRRRIKSPAPNKDNSETLGSGILAENAALSIMMKPSEAVERAAEESAKA